MAYDEAFIRECTERLKRARIRILDSNGFYGLLLTQVQFALDESCETACTDGDKIYFGPDFMKDLNDRELEFVLMHEIMHIVLMHCNRQGDRNNQIFNVAADIVVNSNILQSNDNDVKTITLGKYGEAMHVAPDGNEGVKYTAEEVYEMIVSKLKKAGIPQPSNGNGNGSGGNNSGGQTGKGGKQNGGNGGGGDDDGQDNGQNGSQNGQNQTGTVQGGQNGSGGQTVKGVQTGQGGQSGQGGSGKQKSGGFGSGFFDDHSKWGTLGKKKQKELEEKWTQRIVDAANIVTILKASNQRGTVPLCAQRLINELTKPQTDWRTLLSNFIQEEITDYSFSPPDRRFPDSDFFLPDFNEKEEKVKNVLFMIDTSGSMSDEMITQAYSEIKGAIDQFNGHLEGLLGFFDGVVVEPTPFADEEELKIIRPVGGGGTNFHIIFEYVQEKMKEELPTSIVILTDGYAPFPEEEEAMDIPVLWIINNNDVTPPWGKIARIEI